jgi:hypothetical protein
VKGILCIGIGIGIGIPTTSKLWQKAQTKFHQIV